MERILPFEPAAIDAMIGIHIAMQPEFDKNALIMVQMITIAMMNTLSFFAIEVDAIFEPILCAIPV